MRWTWIATMVGALAVAGCATAPPRPPAQVFYPPPPDAPRIQHLATYSGERDLGELDSALARFVAGEDNAGPQLRQPYGAAMFDGKLYVADTKAPGLVVFDIANRKFSRVTGAGNGRMQRPINVTIDADGTKFVTDTGRNAILVYDRNDRFLRSYGDDKQFKPVDTAIAGDRLYVVDIEHHQIQVLDKRTGQRLQTFGKSGNGEGDLFQPTNIAIGPDGDLYVVETGNFRVQRFKPDGKHVRFYGEIGNLPGQFARPKGIAVDRSGRLYVGDAAFQNVQVFTNDGRLLMPFGQTDEPGRALNLPASVSIDYDSVALFRSKADPKFAIEYVILVVSQFVPNKVDVFGFGRMSGVAYAPDDAPAARPAK